MTNKPSPNRSWIFDCPEHGLETGEMCFRAYDEKHVDHWRCFSFIPEGEIITSKNDRLAQLRRVRRTMA